MYREKCTSERSAKIISARSNFITLWRRKAHRKSRDVLKRLGGEKKEKKKTFLVIVGEDVLFVARD